METLQEIASQWEKLQEKKQEISDRIKELELQILNPIEVPQIKKLLERGKEEGEKGKTELENEIIEIRRRINSLREAIDVRREIMIFFQLAQWDNAKLAEIKKSLRGLTESLKKLETNNKRGLNPDIITCLREQLLKIIGINSQESLEWLEKWNTEDKASKDLLEKSLSVAENDLAELTELCRLVKKSLKNELGTMEEQLKTHNDGIMRWATENRQRLKWILENRRLTESAVINLYKERFPYDDLSDLLPDYLPIPKQTHLPRPLRKKKENGTVPSEVQTAQTKPAEFSLKEWTIRLVFGPNEKGMPIPNDKDSFAESLEEKLRRESSLRHLNYGLLYNELAFLCNLSPSDRVIIAEKISGGGLFNKWIKIRIGRLVRGATDINNDTKEVRFCLGNHTLYKKIRRSRRKK